ncbi:hypothetical protein D3C87_1565040 [compost metagenome]
MCISASPRANGVGLSINVPKSEEGNEAQSDLKPLSGNISETHSPTTETHPEYAILYSSGDPSLARFLRSDPLFVMSSRPRMKSGSVLTQG